MAGGERMIAAVETYPGVRFTPASHSATRNICRAGLLRRFAQFAADGQESHICRAAAIARASESVSHARRHTRQQTVWRFDHYGSGTKTCPTECNGRVRPSTSGFSEVEAGIEQLHLSVSDYSGGRRPVDRLRDDPVRRWRFVPESHPAHRISAARVEIVPLAVNLVRRRSRFSGDEGSAREAGLTTLSLNTP
jgi:hypothetical protein